MGCATYSIIYIRLNKKGCIPLIISIIAPSDKAQRINISIDIALLGDIDLVVHSQHKTRSALLAEAAQRLLGEISYICKYGGCEIQTLWWVLI